MSETTDRPEPVQPLSADRSQPIRRDMARLLDRLYGLHCRPGHIDAVLEVFQLHAPVKAALDRDGQTCEGCRFAGISDNYRHALNFRDSNTNTLGSRNCHKLGWVPLTINGQPFGCRGWQARDTSLTQRDAGAK